MAQSAPLTQLLNDWQSGDVNLMEQIVPQVYDELHRVARGYMHNEASGHTLQATALINEAFCRFKSVNSNIENRGHFVGIVARLMRQILVDHARAKSAEKRGGSARRITLTDADLTTKGPSIDVLALESVLEILSKTDPRKVQIAELHYFCGLTYKQTANALEISESTLLRELSMLKALLKHKLSTPDE